MRRGVTTVELLVGVVVAGLLSTAIGTLLRRQQRFYARAARAIEHRISLRDATSILPAEVRALSPANGDVVAFSDSSLEIRATIGASIVCAMSADGVTVDFVPAGPARGTMLTAFTTTPQPGDMALVYDAGAIDDSLDDAWATREIVGVSSVSGACAASPVVPTELTALPTLRVRLASPLSPAVRTGAFAHVLRRVRYRLYRAATNDWYLGYSEWDGTAFSVVQPVSGPFAPYSRRSADTGLLLRYIDGDDAEVLPGDDVSRITRVEVVARSVGTGGLSVDAMTVRDGQNVTTRVRNR